LLLVLTLPLTLLACLSGFCRLVLQLILVWAAPDASHPSVAEAKRLAAALWSQAGPKQQQGAGAQQANRMAQLRARAEAAAAARSGRPAVQQQQQQQQRGKMRAKQTPAISNSSKGSDAAAAAAAVEAGPLLHSVWLNFQPDDDDNRVLGQSWLLLHGQQRGWQGFGGVPVAVAPGSFIQVALRKEQAVHYIISCWSTNIYYYVYYYVKNF
jgi:hypothetical protein